MQSPNDVCFVGLDLAGPANWKDTACCVARMSADGGLVVDSLKQDMSDHALAELFTELRSQSRVVVGIDAPLSYQDGGGDRVRDKSLRVHLMDNGLHSGSVMTPTMTRMAYLTMRGMAVARLISSTCPPAEILEVHPIGTLVLQGADPLVVRTIKKSASSICETLSWLSEQGLHGIEDALDGRSVSDHMIAALGCVLAACAFLQQKSAWLHPAEPPHHPYPFVC
jgi:uncharacterized protein